MTLPNREIEPTFSKPLILSESVTLDEYEEALRDRDVHLRAGLAGALSTDDREGRKRDVRIPAAVSHTLSRRGPSSCAEGEHIPLTNQVLLDIKSRSDLVGPRRWRRTALHQRRGRRKLMSLSRPGGRRGRRRDTRMGAGRRCGLCAHVFEVLGRVAEQESVLESASPRYLRRRMKKER
jgi:hypothetical protein